MKRLKYKHILMLSLAIASCIYYPGNDTKKLPGLLIDTAEARLGRPATPVSYAGVARRSTVRVATPGVGAPGVGARPAAGAGGNLGGPVNRVGVR